MKLKPTKIVYEPLPHEDEDGRPLFLPVKVTKIETQDASESKYGKEQLKFELTVTGGEAADKKVSMWFNPIISSSDSKKKSKLREFIEAADPGTLEEVEENDEEYDIDDLIGKKVRIIMAEPEPDKFQKVLTVKPAKKSAAEKREEAEDEEEDAPKPKTKKPADEEEDEPKPKAKKAKPAAEEDEEEDRPAPKSARKKLNYKR